MQKVMTDSKLKYKIADISLAAFGRKEIEIAEKKLIRILWLKSAETSS